VIDASGKVFSAGNAGFCFKPGLSDYGDEVFCLPAQPVTTTVSPRPAAGIGDAVFSEHILQPAKLVRLN
jgi:hypothetical protein